MKERLIYELITKIKQYQDREKSISFYCKKLNLDASNGNKLIHELEHKKIIFFDTIKNVKIPKLTIEGVSLCQKMFLTYNKSVLSIS